MNRAFSWHLYSDKNFSLSLLQPVFVHVSFSISPSLSLFFPWASDLTTHKHYVHAHAYKHITQLIWFGEQVASVIMGMTHTLRVRTSACADTVEVWFVFLPKLTVLQELTTKAQYSSSVSLHILTMSYKAYVITKPENH